MSDTQSVLDAMTAGILDRKANKAQSVGLTPVAGEAAPKPPLCDISTPAEFPFDRPDLIQKALADAREQVVFVLDGIDRIIAAFGANPYRTDTVMAPDTKAAEREADERARAYAAANPPDRGPNEPVDFSADYAAKQAAAQAAVFTSGSAAPGWVCPVHGKSSTQETLSKKGRKYRICTKCPEFER